MPPAPSGERIVVGTENRAGKQHARDSHRLRVQCGVGGDGHEASSFGVSIQQRLHFLAQIDIARTDLLQKRGASCRRPVQGRVIKLAHAVEPLRRHRFSRTELAIQPSPRETPVLPHRCHRYLQHFRRFFQAQAGEEAQFHDAGLPRRDGFQRPQSLVERDKIAGSFNRDTCSVGQRTWTAPPPRFSRCLARA